MTDEEVPTNAPAPITDLLPELCRKCGRRFKNRQGITVHMARAHGENWSGRPRRNKKVDRLPVVLPKPPPKVVQDFKEVQGFKLLEDKEGHIWLAERIK